MARSGIFADVWGIGGLLYEALSGDPAVPDTGTDTGTSTPSSSADRSGTTTGGPVTVPAPLRTRRRIPRDVVETIDATLHLDPLQRPTVAEVAGVLAGALGVSPVPHGETEAS